MNFARGSASIDQGLQLLWEDGERVLLRERRPGGDGTRRNVLTLAVAAGDLAPHSVDRLAHEYALRNELDDVWAVRPLELLREPDRSVLVLEDPGGEPLERFLGAALEVGYFLRLAVDIATAVRKLHQRGFVHKDLKPAHILVGCADGRVRLTGFGLASRLPVERRTPEPPETVAGTLAYMAPEQTGRMNRSIDSRSDLYSLGVIYYRMLTGVLPLRGADPMDWVHAHVARKPLPLAQRAENLRGPISDVVMKLLAKTPEERYQSAAGLEGDLRKCLVGFQAGGHIENFPLGQKDWPDRLLVSEKLYGRAREVETLLASLDRVVSTGAVELVLVSGYPGIGKSSIVNELHKALLPAHGMFTSGKFDQYNSDVPYSALAQAFAGLVRALLGKPEAELNGWREALQAALEPNGRLITDIVPELKLILGEQPALPPLRPQEAQRRAQLVFRRFIGVFARSEHPLALFFDDLQWLDAATLDFLEDLLVGSDLSHLMVVAAYRDNQVALVDPLMRTAERIKAADGRIVDIKLFPLTRKDLGQLIADALRSSVQKTAPLAQLVFEKTGGNPLFAKHFLSSLAEEKLLAFDYDATRWTWDADRIRAKGYTDNVVDLMVSKLTQLPQETQVALRLMACVGNVVATRTLSAVLGLSAARVDAVLWPSIRQELIERAADGYRFAHDRVQEGAYSLMPDARRAEEHLRIGRLLLAKTAPESREEAIFEIVNQLNRGCDLITSAAERESVAELNLIAGRRAKASTAYAPALVYLSAARAMLTEHCWAKNYALFFSVESLTAECELLTANMASAEARLSMLQARAQDAHHDAVISRMRLTLYTALDRSDRALEVCLEYLRRRGTNWSAHPDPGEARREYDSIWSQLGGRKIEDLIDLPAMASPDILDILDVLTEIVNIALHTDENLSSLVICRMVNLSLKHGNCDASCFAYVWFAIIGGPRFGDYGAAFQFGRLGYDLVRQRGLTRYEARTYMSFGNLVIPWTRHARSGRDLIVRAFDIANRIGDLTFAAYCCDSLNSNSLTVGDALADLELQAEKGLAFAKAIRFGFVVDLVSVQLALVWNLRGRTSRFGFFNHEGFDETEFERHLATNPVFALPECWYFARKAQARFIAGDHRSAVDASLRAQRVAWTSPSQFERVELCYYGALAHAGCWHEAPEERKQEHLTALTSHYKKFELWAERCPENFENRAALIGAEIARIEGRPLDAEELYERAIRSARKHGFIHNEAIANELASRFYAARNFEQIAHLYLKNARHCYLSWGADGKVSQLDELYPELAAPEALRGRTGVIGAPVGGFDIVSVIKASEAVSGTIAQESLFGALLRIAVTQAGAERGMLVVTDRNEERVTAAATVEDNVVVVELRDDPATAEVLPQSIIRYVLRTREPVMLDDAVADSPFAGDPYVRERRARSVLCVPLMSRSRICGALYLENSLAPRSFAPGRITVLKLLASQAAIALENTRLYRDLAEREAKISRLVDSNIIGIVIWDIGGRIVEANDAFLRMVGYDLADLAAGRVHREALIPPEWRDRGAQIVAELKRTRRVAPVELEFFRKDGSRMPLLIGGAMFSETGTEGVGFVIDLTERKRAEAEARENERRYREVQLNLAHENRLATIGQLTASIAHEVNQPITAAVTNAEAALRWLSIEPMDLDEVRHALERIVRDGTRAGEVVRRIRGHIKKAPPRNESIAINEAVAEVIDLMRRETAKSSICVRAELAEGLPLVEGDRVQLRQVILNLTLNAVEAMSSTTEEPKELQIATGQAETGEIFVSVRDTGPGLTPATLERVFDAFYTTKPDGLGLGLSICRSIIEAHGGRLWAHANVPHGAVFQLVIPARATAPSA